MGDLTMPHGKHKGRPISEMSSGFLFWWVSQLRLRQKWPATVRAMLAELRDRFARGDPIETELLPEPTDQA